MRMASRLHVGRWIIGSAFGAVVDAFVIGLLGMLVKVFMTGNPVAYIYSVVGGLLSVPVAVLGVWWTLALAFWLAARRNETAARRLSYGRAGLLWGVAHSLVAVALCAMQTQPALIPFGFDLSLVTGTAVTASMIYMPLAPDHLLILLGPLVAGWLAGGLFGLLNGSQRGGDVSGAAAAAA
jgi:hypothetical protein